jgi:hypothetical protein
MVPVKCKIAQDALVQLLYELDIKGLCIVGGIGQELVNVIDAILGVLEVAVCQFA